MKTENITGPELFIDRDKCLRNIDRMVGKARDNDLIFRPHFKTHQSLAVGEWFRERGVDRITVSSLKMAYYFARAAWEDILVGIAYNPREYKLYEKLSEKCKVSLTVSCPDSARLLADQCRFATEVMIKIDTGYKRTGIRWDEIEELKKTIDCLVTNHRISIRGLMTHDGTTYGLSSRQSITEHYNDSVEKLNNCRKESGISDLLLSVGDTPSASVIDNFTGIDELRPGNFVFYDLMQYVNGNCKFSDIALALICPVIDVRPSTGSLVIHGGAVHFSKERIIINGKPVYGMLARLDRDGWHEQPGEIYLSSLSQEHGIINCLTEESIKNTQPGDLLAVIPVHSCLTADCIGAYTLKSGDRIDHMRQLPQASLYSLW